MRRLQGLALTAGMASAALAGAAHASESGTSFYLLGSGGPGTAIMPPLRGVFFSNTAYYYHGVAGANREFQIGGNVVAGIRATIAADFPTVLWAPSTNFLGGTAAVGAIVPFGQPWVDASAVLTGPRGASLNVGRSDTAFVFGDPVFLGMLGWQRGKTHFQLSNLLNIPVGHYREGELANLAFHRWANDMSAAVSWHDDTSGWDLSAKSGFTLNGENPATDYRTGTEWHLEAAVDKVLTPAWSVGAQAYHFDQLTGDSGSGNNIGPFKGRVTGIGGSVAYNFKVMGKIPVSLRFHGATEFDAVNRLEGHAFWLDLSMPLHVRMPPGAPAT
jgi:hypothetical protein